MVRAPVGWVVQVDVVELNTVSKTEAVHVGGKCNRNASDPDAFNGVEVGMSLFGLKN